MKRDQAIAALDAAFTAHVSAVFARLASDTEPNTLERFGKTWDNAVKLHDQMVEKIS